MTQPTSPDTLSSNPGFIKNPGSQPPTLIDSLAYWKGGARELKSFRGHTQ